MKNTFSIFLSVLLLASACTSGKKESASPALADSVEVFSLQRKVATKKMSLPAQLLPWERAEVFAKVEGYVRELKVDIGDRVRKNDVLVILDAPEVMANYAKSTSDLQAAKSKYQTSLDLFKRTVIASQEQGAVSDSELERIKNQMLSDSASYEAAESGADAYQQLKNYLLIRAAFDGVITQRNVHPGTLVGKEQTPMIVLENNSRLRLHVAVPETYASAIPESISISFTVESQPSKEYSATLARKSNQIDEKTRTELWEFEVPNTGKELKSGMYGNASFRLKRSEPTFVVPYSAVVTTLEKQFVIRARDGRSEQIDVHTGIVNDNEVEIFGDLQEGDLLLSSPNDEIRTGQPVVAKMK